MRRALGAAMTTPNVYPCPRRKYTEDRSFEYIEIICDGCEHVLIPYRDGQRCYDVKLPLQRCPRWIAADEATRRLRAQGLMP